MIRRHSAHRRGAQAVEFALVAPILVLIMAGIVDTSWYISQYSAVLQAARDGARSGAVEDNAGAVIESVNTAQESLDMLGLDSGSANITPAIVTVSGQDSIQLDIEYPYNGIFNFPGITLPVSYTVSATYRVEGN